MPRITPSKITTDALASFVAGKYPMHNTATRTLGNGENLNDITTAGKYFCGEASKAQTMSNVPFVTAFFLYVITVPNTAYTVQYFIRQQEPWTVYTRRREASDWSAWHKFTTN